MKIDWCILIITYWIEGIGVVMATTKKTTKATKKKTTGRKTTSKQSSGTSKMPSSFFDAKKNPGKYKDMLI